MRQRTEQQPLAVGDLINERHAVSTTAQQCTATSKRTGLRCRAWALKGARTCRMHGSATRKARVAAAERIRQASGYAADMLVEFMADPKVEIGLRTKIAQDLLSRAGITEKHQLNLGMEPRNWDDVMAGVLVDIVPADDDANIVDAEVVEPEPAQPPAARPAVRAAGTDQPTRPTAAEQRRYEQDLVRRLRDDPDSPEYRPRRKRRGR